MSEKKFYGYMGRILRVDLTRQKVVSEELSEKMARNFVGGTGFAGYILFNELKPGIDPLGPENILIFATGPVTGTLWPGSGEYIVAAKSPVTGIYGESHSTWNFGAELKQSGYDMIIFYGSSENPVYLYIDNGDAKIIKADDIWGKTTGETNKILKEKHGKDIHVACIGPAGENMVKMAAIVTDHIGTCARCAIGAVMGSKKLKAVAVRGDFSIEVYDPDGFFEFYLEQREKIEKDPFVPGQRTYGTTLLVSAMQTIGRLPTKNHYQGVFDHYDRINEQQVVKRSVGHIGCHACPISCRNVIKIQGPYGSYIKEHPEYEAFDALGANVLNADFESIVEADRLCDEYGMDVISVGGVIAWAMECYEKGIITKEDTGDLELKWGDPNLILKLVKMIAFREGFGNILAEGVRKASQIVGRGSEKYAMHVKGLEISAQDGRAQKSMGLAHVTSNRGADHLYSSSFLDEVGFEEIIISRFGEQYLPEMADRLSPKYKWLMVYDCENLAVLMDALTVCKLAGNVWPPLMYFGDVAKLLRLTTGFPYTEKEVRIIGERIVNLHRAFNIREGISKKDDVLPDRFTKEPAPKGPNKGHVVELDYMLPKYYELRGWDSKTGWIKKEKLEELDLDFVITELEKLGKLPD